jgi:hypothetical protein
MTEGPLQSLEVTFAGERLNERGCLFHAVLIANLTAQEGGLSSHPFVMNNLADRLSQSSGSQVRPGDRGRSCAQLMDAPSPKELICERGDDNAGQACAQRRTRRAGSAVMDNGDHSGE